MTVGPRRSSVIADAFWAAGGGRALFGDPIDVERVASRVLPLAVYRIPSLSTDDVRGLLARIGADPWRGETSRPLRGCLVADAGVGLIFVDRTDPEDEQRMTVAHELAHFLLHYLQPRNDAIAAFGPMILGVLDRTRPPTLGERFASALRDVPIEPFRHVLDRHPGQLAGRARDGGRGR